MCSAIPFNREMESMMKVVNVFKPDLSDRKSKILFGVKVAFALLYTAIMVYFFAYERYLRRYLVDRKPTLATEKMRIVVVLLLWIVGMIVLFANIKLTKKQNTIASIVVTVIALPVIFVNTQMSINSNSVLKGLLHVFSMRPIFLVFNMFILVTIFLVLYAIFNSFKIPIMTMAISSCVLCIINYYVTAFRGTAFLAVDFTTVGTGLSVADQYDYSVYYTMIQTIMLTMFLCFVVSKLDRNPIKFWWARVAVIVLAVVCILVGYTKIWNSTHYDKLIKVKYYKPQKSYARKGFYLTFLKSIKDLQIKKPEGYSPQVVEDMAKKYKGTKQTAKKAPNIIVIMDEAFSDYSSIADLKINKDNLPFLHSLKKNTISGRLYVPVWGGGTVSTEFEALTSNSMAFVPNGITCYTTYIQDPMTSLVSTTKGQNMGIAEASHPFRASDYKRDKVYKLFGFDKYYGREDYGNYPDVVGRHVSDKADVEKIIEKYKNFRKKSDKPYLMFNVTMQNHSPYNNGNVNDGFKLEYPDTASMPEANEYMNLTYHSEQAFKEIVDYFKKVDENTIILFFGDHQPRLEDSFYAHIEKDFKFKDVPESERKRIANYYLWANYDIEEKQDYDISSNYLTNLVLKTAGLGMSGYQQYTTELMKDIPIFSVYGCFDKNGKLFEYDDKNSGYYDRINKYNIAQYNNMHDVKHRVNKFFDYKKK